MRDKLTVIGNALATASGQIPTAADKGRRPRLVGRRQLQRIARSAAPDPDVAGQFLAGWIRSRRLPWRFRAAARVPFCS